MDIGKGYILHVSSRALSELSIDMSKFSKGGEYLHVVFLSEDYYETV